MEKHEIYKVICPYDGTKALLIDSAEIYGVSYGYAYRCPKCGAFVGCHKGTSSPLGTLADAELRAWRKKAHRAFDPTWKRGKMKRKAAYAWLSEQMGIDIDHTHIAMFNVDQCRRVVEIVEARQRETCA